MKMSIVLLALLTPLALVGCSSPAESTVTAVTTTSTSPASTAPSRSTTSSSPVTSATTALAPGAGLSAALNTLAVKNKAIPTLHPIRTQVDAGNKQLGSARTVITSMRSSAYANPHNCVGARGQLPGLEASTSSATQAAGTAERLIAVRRQAITDLRTAITAVEAATTAQRLTLSSIPTVQAAVNSGQAIATKETDSTTKSATAASTVIRTASQLRRTGNQILGSAHC